MRLSSFALALVGGLAAAPALAQTTGFYVRGLAMADVVRNAGGTAQSAMLDLDVGIAPQGSGSLGGVGFELGVYGFAVRSGGVSNSDGTLYGGLTFALGGGRLLVGAPRSVAMSFNDAVLPTNSSVLALTALTTGILPTSVFLSTVVADEPFWGLRYDRSSGNTNYSVALSRMEFGPIRVTAVSGGARHDFGASTVYGTFEMLSSPGAANIGSATIGASTTLAGGGSSLGEIELGGFVNYSDNGATQGTNVGLYATIRPMDRLSLSASMLDTVILGGRSYGLNATYDVWNGVAVNAGLGHASAGGNAVWTLGLQRRF